MLSAALKSNVWQLLRDAGAKSDDQADVAKQIETALSRYGQIKKRPKPVPGREEQKTNAKKIIKAVRSLEEAIEQSDRETRKRVYIGIAKTLDYGKQKRAKVGKVRLGEQLAIIRRAAERAEQRSGKKKSSKGVKAADPGLVTLVADLAEIWEDSTGTRFEAERKDHRKGGGEKLRSRKFVDVVLVEALGIEKNPGALSNLLTKGRQEVNRRNTRSEESEESEAEYLDE